MLGSKYGPRLPLLVSAGAQFLNALIILLITPESNSCKVKELNLAEANPIGGLKKLFGHAPILRSASIVYFLSSLARGSLDAQFTNYSNIRFGWTQAQAGPVLVLVGLMLAIVPRAFISSFGLRNAILTGLLVFAAGLTGAGLTPTPASFVFSIFIVSIGCMWYVLEMGASKLNYSNHATLTLMWAHSDIVLSSQLASSAISYC